MPSLCSTPDTQTSALFSTPQRVRAVDGHDIAWGVVNGETFLVIVLLRDTSRSDEIARPWTTLSPSRRSRKMVKSFSLILWLGARAHPGVEAVEDRPFAAHAETVPRPRREA